MALFSSIFRFLLPVSCFVFAGLVLSTCKPDDELYRLKKTKWVPEIVMPIANARLSIEEVLSATGEQNGVIGDENGKIVLHYNGTLASGYGYEILQFANRQFEFLHDQLEFELRLHPNVLINELNLKAGSLHLMLNGDDLQSIDSVYVDFKELQLDKQNEFRKGFSDLSSLETPLNLADARINFQPQRPNFVAPFFRVFDKDGLDISDGYSMIFAFRDLAFKTVLGWYDNFVMSIERDTVDLDVFKRWKSGSVKFDDPKILLGFYNSFGIAITGSLSTFHAVNEENGGTVIPIELSNVLGDSFIIEYPTSQQIGEIVNSTYEVNGDNSNLRNVISFSPKLLEFGINLIAKHDIENQPSGLISDSSRFNLELDVQLPLTGRIQHVIARDTIAVSTTVPDELEAVEKATLQIVTSNRLPLGVQLQCYLLDSNLTVFDSVFTSKQLLAAAVVNENGRAVEESKNENGIRLSAEKLRKLADLRYVAFETRMNTSGGLDQTVSFYTEDFLKMQISLQMSYQIR